MRSLFIATVLLFIGCNQVSGADDITFPKKGDKASDNVSEEGSDSAKNSDAGVKPDAGQ